MNVFIVAGLFVCFAQAKNNKFPEDFLIGFGTSSYQSEGAWNEDGKGPSIWDALTLKHPNYIVDGTNASIADDSYHKYKEDVKLLKDLKAQVYRFSLSWSRILPSGMIDEINQPGIDYYNHLIDELIANGIKPLVSLYHLDLPENLQRLGGWANPVLADYFEDYARLAFKSFGDRVIYWTTFDGPQIQCIAGYGTQFFAPGVKMPGVGEYLCAHTMLLAHAKAYHLYQDDFKEQQKGYVGISLHADAMIAKSELADDVTAAETANEFLIGWFANPIFAEEGDYPLIMMEQISENSYAEGRYRSRLPEFTNETLQYVRGTADFLGLYHFTTFLTEPAKTPSGQDPSWTTDTRVSISQNPSWKNASIPNFAVVPWGIRKTLKHIKLKYNNPYVVIAGNGYSDKGEINDTKRIDYHKSYMQEMLNAIYEDGCNVVGYIAKSLLDTFEWNLGYSFPFGIYKVDFSKEDRPRTAKASASFFKSVISSRSLPAKKSRLHDNRI